MGEQREREACKRCQGGQGYIIVEASIRKSKQIESTWRGSRGLSGEEHPCKNKANTAKSKGFCNDNEELIKLILILPSITITDDSCVRGSTVHRKNGVKPFSKIDGRHTECAPVLIDPPF